MNAIATYGRTVFALLVGLFSVRWVLHALGEVDYGLNGLVGACLVFVSYFNTIVSGAVSRYYAFAIGAGDAKRHLEDSVSDWFNTALSIHLCLAVVLGIAGAVLGECAVRYWLTIPFERMETCLWVWRFSLVVVIFNCVAAPYIAMFYAKQNIAELSLYGVASTCCVAIVAYCVEFIDGDRLLFYACMSTMYHVALIITQVVRAHVLFPECRIVRSSLLSLRRTISLTKFTGWVIYAAIGEVVRNQGTAVLVNKVWGPQINASYAIANQVAGQTTSIASSLQTALSPALTSEAGSGNRTVAVEFVFRIERMCALLVLMFAVPLIFEMHTVLQLWLGNVPLYVPELCVAMLVMLFIEKITIGHAMAIESYNKMGPYQIVAGTAAILSLPLIFLLYWIGGGPLAIGIAFVSLASVKLLGRIICCSIQLKLSAYMWLRSVFCPMLLVVLVTGCGCATVMHFAAASLVRVFITIICSSLSCGMMVWLVVLDHREKDMLRMFGARMLQRWWR